MTAELFAGSCCEDCGRHKLGRLFALSLTGCATCDEVITRHRCTGRPPVDEVANGIRWECPVCGSVWTAHEHQDTCGECGQPVLSRCWELTADRRADGPRRDPGAYVPLRHPT